MMSMMRKRREAERHKKLEELFKEFDVNCNGRITKEQVMKIFKVNDVVGKFCRPTYEEKGAVCI